MIMPRPITPKPDNPQDTIDQDHPFSNSIGAEFRVRILAIFAVIDAPERCHLELLSNSKRIHFAPVRGRSPTSFGSVNMVGDVDSAHTTRLRARFPFERESIGSNHHDSYSGGYTAIEAPNSTTKAIEFPFGPNGNS